MSHGIEHHLLAQPAAAPSVPFWLQVVAIALAPFMGFLGVAVGAFLKDRSDRVVALHKERRELYSEYLNALAKFNHHYGNVGALAFRQDETVKYREYINVQHEMHALMIGLITRIDLVASQAVVDAAHKFYHYIVVITGVQVKAIDEGWVREEWNRGVALGARIAREFRNAAIRDVGIPRRDRGRRAMPDSSPEWEESMVKFTTGEIERKIDDRGKSQS
ncbi:hypothetical protein [Saccharothrix lopnurensis]|uniref:Uncharacterized protein n=1 Tax=Saccharothrix lopnurensis TaxID=1670621 RepID=A0ABW1P4V6_9PSEU